MVQLDVGAVTEAIRHEFPDLQALYVFGSMNDGTARATSDVDLGVLLPHRRAQDAGSLAMSDLRFQVEAIVHREVDLINVRLVSMVFRKEIIAGGTAVFVGDERAVAEFEMLTMSLYQKLNEERREILRDLVSTGRAYRL